MRSAFADIRSKLRIRKPIITGGLKKRITTRLSKGWSPKIIVGRLRDEKVASLSHETVYRFLRKNPEHAIKHKFYKRRGYGLYRQLMARPSMDDRNQMQT